MEPPTWMQEDCYKKFTAELDKYLNNEFLDELELEKQINTTQGEDLLKKGFALELRSSTLKMQENAEMMVTLLECPLDKNYPAPVVKNRGTMFISSTDPIFRANRKAGKNKLRGTILSMTKYELLLVFSCQSREIQKCLEMDTNCTLEVVPELVTLERTKFFKSLTEKLFSNPSSLMRKVLHYVSDGHQDSEFNWRHYQPRYDQGDILGPNFGSVVVGMNERQKEAVKKAITCQDYFLLHGPPGTGKSHTLVRLIKHLLVMGKRVLVTTHSNMALDKLLVDSLKDKEFKEFNPVRLGDPARSDPVALMYNMRNQVSRRFKERRHTDVDNDRKDQDIELSILGDSKIVTQINQNFDKTDAQIVFSTQVMMLREDIFKYFSADDKKFDYAVIDEASQSPFITSLVPICLSKRVIFAGDHHQLPPSLKPERNSYQNGFAKYKHLLQWDAQNEDEDMAPPKDVYFKSLFERILEKEKEKSNIKLLNAVPANHSISVMLEVQYKMFVSQKSQIS